MIARTAKISSALLGRSFFTLSGLSETPLCRTPLGRCLPRAALASNGAVESMATGQLCLDKPSQKRELFGRS
jgi:hypothetical protein